MSSAAGSSGRTSGEIPAEYVVEQFDTTVPDGAVESLAERIEGIVSGLRNRVTSDDRVEELLRGQPGPDQLHRNDTNEGGDPEPFTQRRIIEPLFDELAYPDFTTEATTLSDEQRQKADYLFSLREFDAIESSRLLVEAEPLNKKLDQHSHGLGQVKDWLDTYSFDADFGFATDGVRWVLIKHDRERYQYDTLAEIDLQPVFIAAFENCTGRRERPDEWLDDTTTLLLERFIRAFGFENFVAVASEAKRKIDHSKSAATAEFYDQYVRRVFGVLDEGEDERTTFSLVEDGIIAPEAANGDDERLFAVELMNRLIFVKFLEDRDLVPTDLLADLADTYNPNTYPQSLYETFLEPLFFGVLDERPSERSEQIKQVGFYTDVPYLNGGLFRPHENTERGFTDKGFDVRDAVMTSIIEFLEAYTFSADGSPDDLDPSILGNVFEKTINYLTGDSSDSKKQLGAYYTPDEITRFCAEGTVQPWLLERFQDTMIEDLGRERVDMERYDDLFALIERAVPQDANVVEALLEDVDDLRALDPACGSGHFLTSVLGEIVTVRKALYEKHPEDPQSWELHKQTVTENIYGVDIVEPAVEIAKLRLWLSIIAEVDVSEIEEYDEDDLALPNVVFNVQHGNSLVGYTDLMETDGDSPQMRIDAWGSDTVRTKYEKVIEQMHLHKKAEDTDTAREHLLKAEELREGYRDDLDERILDEFREAGIEDITSERVAAQNPFHWVLEFAPVYADGGFDVIIGNPPWDRLTPQRDEFFSRYDEGFRGLLPEAKAERQETLLEQPGIEAEWDEYRRGIEIRAEYFGKSSAYQMQAPTIGGRTQGTESDLSALFLERVFTLAKPGGFAAQVLPGAIFNGASTKDLRTHLLDQTTISELVTFENRGIIFPEIHNQYNFGVVTFRNEGRTESLRGIFQQVGMDVLQDFDDSALEIPRQVLREYSPEARIFPYIDSQKEVEALNTILRHPPISDRHEGEWYIEPYRELDRGSDVDRFIENESRGDYPVLGGSNIYQFMHDSAILDSLEAAKFWSVDEIKDPDLSAKRRIREKNYRRLKRGIYDAFDGTGSQVSFVNELLEERRGTELDESDVLLDCTEFRIAYRDIARSTDERTLIATVLPKGVVAHHKAPTFRPYRIDPEEQDLSETPLHSMYERIFTDRELFVAVGMLNSIPFDFLMRTKVDSTVVFYKLTESQLPHLTDGDDWFEYISSRAARLNCYGDAFAEMRERLGGLDPATEPGERERLRVEIDAAAFHAYGLGRDETAFILDDFHRVQNPRLMTESYFERVLDKYDTLAESGPLP